MWENWVQSLDWEDPLEKGIGYPLKYSCLENSMDRGAWQATVHGIAESDMTEWLSFSLYGIIWDDKGNRLWVMLQANSTLINYLDCLNACKGKMFPTVKVPQSRGVVPWGTTGNSSHLMTASACYQNDSRNSYQMLLIVAPWTPHILLRFTPIILLHSPVTAPRRKSDKSIWTH